MEIKEQFLKPPVEPPTKDEQIADLQKQLAKLKGEFVALQTEAKFASGIASLKTSVETFHQAIYDFKAAHPAMHDDLHDLLRSSDAAVEEAKVLNAQANPPKPPAPTPAA